MSRNFNGSTDRLDWANVQSADTAQTLCAWVYLAAYAGAANRRVLAVHWAGDSSDRLRMSIAPDGKPHFLIPTDGTQMSSLGTTGGASAGVWTHLTWSWNGTIGAPSNFSSYTDGVAAASYTGSTGTGSFGNMNGTWSLGGHKQDDLFNLGAILAHLAWWNVQLAAGEIAALARGAQPQFMRRDALKFYAPLWGTHAQEPNLVAGGGLATHDGTTVGTHNPPVAAGHGRHLYLEPSLTTVFPPGLFTSGVAA